MCVVLAHALPKITPVPEPVPAAYYFISVLSAVGMPLFFVLSGFVIHYNYFAVIKERPRQGLWQFYISRFARLYPMYLAVVAFDLLTNYGYGHVPAAEPLPYYALLIHTWVYRVFGEHSLPYQYGLMPQVTWSISTEWFFYCVYPLICAAIWSARKIWMLALIVLAVAAISSSTAIWFNLNQEMINVFAASRWGPVADARNGAGESFTMWALYFSPYMWLYAFIVGACAADLHTRLSQIVVTPAEARWGEVGTSIALAGIILVFVMSYSNSYIVWLGAFRISGLVLVPPIAILLFCCARYQTIISRALASPTMVRFGEASYSIYLLHVMVIAAYRWDAAPILSWPIAMTDILRLAVTLATVIGLSLLTYEWIEVPCRNGIRRLLLSNQRAERSH
jgi:peptidoglycan/LPS O-acetylase OafA/YrhL